MFKKSIFITVLSLMATLCSFINQLTIAYFFGAKKNMDLFFAVTSSPAMIGGILIVTLNYSLTPYLKEIQIKENDATFQILTLSLYKKIVKIVNIICVVGLALILSYQYFLLNIFNSYSILLTIVTLLTIYFSIKATFLASLHNINNSFMLPTIINLFPPLFSIIIIFLTHTKLNTLSIQIGMCLGAIISFFIIQMGFKKQLIGNNNEIITDELINKQEKYINSLPYIMVGTLVFTVYQVSDSFWASKLQTSSVSYLAYLQRIVTAVAVIVIFGPSVVLTPKLTEYFVLKKDAEFSKLFIKALRWILYISSFVVLNGVLFSHKLLILLFKRTALNSTDIQSLSTLFPIMLVGMSFMLCFTIMFRILFIDSNKQKISMIGIVAAFTYFILSGIGSYYLKITGICWAYTTTWFVICLLTIFFINQKVNSVLVFNNQLIVFLIKLIATTLSTLYLSNLLINKFDSIHIISSLNPIFILILYVYIIGIIYISISSFLIKINEGEVIMVNLKKALKRYKSMK